VNGPAVAHVRGAGNSLAEGLLMTALSLAHDVKHESIWAATTKMPAAVPLQENVHADVCIVGAGIAGLTTAYMLTKAGKSVVVLDDGPLAGGMTEVTTAHLTNAIDDRYYEIERIHGAEGARLAAESHTAAIHRIEAVARAEGIECDFARLDGYLFLPPGEDPEILDRELAAAKRAGLVDMEKVLRAPLGSFDTGPCLRFPNQGQFHPLKYLAGLVQAIRREGGRLYGQTHADRIDGGSPARVIAGHHVVSAGAVVVATNSPVNDLVAIHTKQAPYMTYVIGAKVQRGLVAEALYWDTGRVSTESRPVPYHYVRLQRLTSGTGDENGGEKKDLLIIGGEDHKSGQASDTEKRHDRLEQWARERFPQIEQIEFTWGGQVMETVDGLAYIGRNPMDKDNVFVVTGDSGMGMTHGTIAGILLTDLIMGRENPWEKLYDPARIRFGAAGTYAREAMNVAIQYADWVTGGEVSSMDEIGPDSGAVVRRGTSKVAVYRDERGIVHERSAVCSHLGCIVHWNAAEKTWDCPCHGSRFTSLGKVINGPANQDLTPVAKS
jgi:glycine/D-amino acid oxidase-like deaminating enzyme/nitrite reductase/ring-hydroxylating ferredoxin subunit